MPKVYMNETPVVQTVGAGGIGVSPPVPVEKVEKISGNTRGMEEVVPPVNRIPNPIDVGDGAVIQERNNAWQTGADLPDPTNATDGMVLAVEDGKYIIADSSVQTDVADLVADPYDPNSTYDVGDIVVYQNKLYVCKTAISTAEAWTAAHWDEKNMAEALEDGLASQSEKIDELKTVITQISEQGPNLFPNVVNSITVNSVECTFNKGVLTLIGAASANGGRTQKIIPDFVLTAGTYTMSAYPRGNINGFLQTSSGNNIIARLDGNSGVNTFTLLETTTVYFGFSTTKDAEYGSTKYLMLESGETAHDWFRTGSIAVDNVARETSVDLGLEVTRATTAEGELQEQINGKASTAELNNLIIISDTEPASEDNKIWINSSESSNVLIPTYEDLINVYPTKTLTEQSTANFTDGANNIPVKSLIAKINPVQAGSGDPSPDNIRAISGWNSVNIYRSDADTTNPTTFNIELQSVAGTVYGGILDVTNGVLTVNMVIVDLGTLTWSYDSDYIRFYTNDITDYKRPTTNNVPANFICSCYRNVSGNGTASASNDKTIGGNGAVARIFVRDTSYGNDASAFETAMSGAKLVYELSTPTVYNNVDKQIIKTLLGVNNIWADSGNVDITYRADIALYITNALS